ncbi:MAG TPA: hypothetical protein VJU86_07735 [Pyrinomonadaceae bacterium]|nr:hypothetical protein [Pyrinomonadaceae bacterium]
MKRARNQKVGLTRRPRRLLLKVVVVGVVVFAIGAITVLSRVRSETRRTAAIADQTETKASVTHAHTPLNTQDAQPQELSQEEAEKLGAGLRDLVNQSPEGLTEVKHADGSVSLDQQGRFQSVTVARINKDGSITQSCVDNPRAAAAFFRIDPKLIDKNEDSGGTKPARITPATTSN